MDTDGNGYKNIYSFNDTDGADPLALTLSGSKLFGMTYSGGAYFSGVIYSVDTNGTGYKKLLDFKGYPNGSVPEGNLTLSGGVLYGMTSEGGAYNDGLIFSIDTDGSGFKRIYYFNDTNGSIPFGSLVLSTHVLYGMTSHGGRYNKGVIFKVDTNLIDTNIVTSANAYLAKSISLSIYPNPSNGIFTIALSHSKLYSESQTIKIYSVLGAQVYDATLNLVQGDNLINVSNQPNGVYFYRVIEENGELIGSGKIIIEK